KIPGLMELLGRSHDCLNLSQTPLEQAVDTAYSNCVGKAPDFVSIGRRIEKAREQTLEWLRAEWPANATLLAPMPSGYHSLLKLVWSLRETETSKLRHELKRSADER